MSLKPVAEIASPIEQRSRYSIADRITGVALTRKWARGDRRPNGDAVVKSGGTGI